MRISQIRLAGLALSSGIVLSACAYDMYGDPYGYGYGYGPRSSISIGLGYGGYGGYGYGYPYGGYGYGGYAYPYGGYNYHYPYGGYDPFGWYGDYYYPGAGAYVYDRSRIRHVWSGDQQRYWTQRRLQWQNHSGTTASSGENWSGWDRSRSRDRTATSVRTGTWTHGSGSGHASSSTDSTSNGDREPGGHHRRYGDRND